MDEEYDYPPLSPIFSFSLHSPEAPTGSGPSQYLPKPHVDPGPIQYPAHQQVNPGPSQCQDQANSQVNSVLPDDGSRQHQVRRNLMGGNGTGQRTDQDYASGPIQYPAHQQVNPGPSQYQYQANSQVNSVLPDHGSRQHQVGRNLMGGNGTGQRTDQGFASGGCISNLGQPLGSGLPQDKFAPTVAANQPGKTRTGKTSAEASRDCREKKKAKFNEMENDMARLRKENEAAKRELDDSNRKAGALHREVEQWEKECARYKEELNQQQNQMQLLTKLLENLPSQQEENARLKGEITKLLEENTKLKDQNDLLMQERYGDPEGNKKWIKIDLQNRSYKLKNHILKVHRLSRND